MTSLFDIHARSVACCSPFLHLSDGENPLCNCMPCDEIIHLMDMISLEDEHEAHMDQLKGFEIL
jgi:hypothetical protein